MSEPPTEAPGLRPPHQVMRLSRLGASHPTRLSFARQLIRRLATEKTRVARPVWDVDAQGFGQAVYRLALGGRTYSLAAFCGPLAAERRSDRVIADAWDASFALIDGDASPADLARLRANAPKQEAGRFSARELVLSRANKSVRFFEHVADSLAAGRQPDREMLSAVGYLMRTTAVYGNGKFGLMDRGRVATVPALAGPFQAEMLAVWLIRGFTHDLVEHIARARDPAAFRPLDRASRRHIGVGNATGLGMAPFLVKHASLLNNWVAAREQALARVRALPEADDAAIERFRALLARARAHVAEWRVDDPEQSARLAVLRGELAQLAVFGAPDRLRGAARPWDAVIRWSEAMSLEAQEMAVALVLEPHGALVDALAEAMACPGAPPLDPTMTAEALRALLARRYAWALEIDFSQPEADALFWYVSAEKMEPRLGLRRSEPGAELESPLDVARQVQALDQALAEASPDEHLAWLLMRRPDLRAIARRAQIAQTHPYAEIQDNLIGAGMRPIDLLRAKLAFFGASKFDPKSDRWTRITLFQGAPCRDALAEADADDWAFPTIAGGAPEADRSRASA